MRPAVLGLVFGSVLAACGTGEGVAPRAATDDLVTCVGPPFSTNAFGRAADAETRAGSEGDALREAITGEPFGPEPVSGWRELGRSDEEVAFATGTPPVLGGYVVLRRRDDAWTYSQSGSGCVVRPYRDGLSMARWGLDPAAASLDTTTESIDVVVNDENCASGVGPEDRLLDPVVEAAPDAVTVTFASRPPEGAQNCPSHPPARRRVQLPEPLGDRRLLDGSLYPPQAPCRVERGDCVNERDAAPGD